MPTSGCTGAMLPAPVITATAAAWRARPGPGHTGPARRQVGLEWGEGKAADARWKAEFDLATVTGHAFPRSRCGGTASFRSFQQRKLPGPEQSRYGVDLGLGCGVVRVRPQHGGGVVQAVQLGCGLCHVAA